MHINQHRKTAYEGAFGFLDYPAQNQPVTAGTWYDLASLTKLFTTTAFLQLVAQGRCGLDTPVREILPDFAGNRPIQPYENPLQPGAFVVVTTEDGTVDAGLVTCRHLLTHTSGLPAWRPLYKQPTAQIRTAVLGSFFSYPTGTRVIYSDLGFILLGWIVEKLARSPLSEALRRLVIEPLGNIAVRYGPLPSDQTAPAETCPWRGRQMRGEVHDENAWALGGVAGHAGLFGTAAAVAALGQTWLDGLKRRSGFLPASLLETAVSLQAEDSDDRRGLGWALWSPDPADAMHPLSPSSFGHTGFTGTSLVVDPQREIVIACLTNEVANGRHNRAIRPFRRRLHQLTADA